MSSPYFNDDTIAAIITAPNAMSGLGVIRISGQNAWRIVGTVLKNASGEKFYSPETIESHLLNRCRVVDSKESSIDDGMFVWMKAPRSFTGEDVIELHLHGNPLLLRRVMDELQRRGARAALPGEFSFRAFRNGKISLDQAESVADLISSRSEDAAKRALGQLLGHSKEPIARLKRGLIDRLAEIELDIDFSDQGVSIFNAEAWASGLEDWCSRVEKVRSEFVRTRPLREGIRLALVGEPNSGKSSLFNRLLGEDRSIVSAEAGTTRDVVRESLEIRGLLFRLSDTAGIRETTNSIEAEGIERSFGETDIANLILWVFDGSAFSGDASGLSKIRQRFNESAKIIAIWNKTDLAGSAAGAWVRFFEANDIPWVSISALAGGGIDLLLDRISELFQKKEDDQPDFWISRMRHFEVLGMAVDSVRAAISKVRAGELFPDLLAADLRSALHRIGEISGEVTSEDLLNHIFSEFCIGK